MDFNYKYKGETRKYNGKFEKIDEEEALFLDGGKVNYTKTMKLNNGMDIHDFNYKLNQITNLKPEYVYFDRLTGEEVTKSDSAVDGGRKFYTSTKTDLTSGSGISEPNYIININLNASSGSQQIASFSNNKCEIEVYRDEDTYRIIDVINPFVNNTREIPWNWRNYTQDFTNTIHKDTWSDSRTPLYSFDLSKEQISSIKSSNANNKEAYLGTCHESESMQDPIMKEICRVINSK